MKNKPVTVACVLRSGGDFKPEHVERLYRDVTSHTDCRFVALSDAPVACERIPLVTNWPGWLAKLELFRPGLFDRPVVFLDLDTVVVGDLSFLARETDGFSMLSDFYHPQIPASGVMSWCGDYSHIFERFSDDLVPQYKGLHPNRGDCGWIARQVGAVDRIPDDGRVVSYKVHVARNAGPRSRGDGTVPDAARVVCFHGRPRPWEVRL